MDIKFGELAAKDRAYYLLYEFLGSAALVIAFNLSVGASAALIFAMTLIGWDLSSCHFNSGVSLAQLVFEHRSTSSLGQRDLTEIVLKVCTQFLGGLLGILIVYSATNVTYLNGQQYAHPTDMHICPSAGCANGLQKKAFIFEFLCSFIFYFLYLLVRNYRPEQKGEFEGFLKPFLIAASYFVSMSLFATNVACIANPTIVLSTWVWNAGFEGSNQVPNSDKTFYDLYHLGRYIWIYLAAPLLASGFAGSFANIHLQAIQNADYEEKDYGDAESDHVTRKNDSNKKAAAVSENRVRLIES